MLRSLLAHYAYECRDIVVRFFEVVSKSVRFSLATLLYVIAMIFLYMSHMYYFLLFFIFIFICHARFSFYMSCVCIIHVQVGWIGEH